MPSGFESEYSILASAGSFLLVINQRLTDFNKRQLEVHGAVGVLLRQPVAVLLQGGLVERVPRCDPVPGAELDVLVAHGPVTLLGSGAKRRPSPGYGRSSP